MVFNDVLMKMAIGIDANAEQLHNMLYDHHLQRIQLPFTIRAACPYPKLSMQLLYNVLFSLLRKESASSPSNSLQVVMNS